MLIVLTGIKGLFGGLFWLVSDIHLLKCFSLCVWK